MPAAAGASAPSAYTTVTLYSPGKAPSLGLVVVSRKAPSLSVVPEAKWLLLVSVGRNVTSAPSTGLPSSVTAPLTGTFPSPPQPGQASAATAAAATHGSTRRVIGAPSRKPSAARGRGPSGQLEHLAVVAAAEVLVGAHVEGLLEEPDGAVGEAEVRPAGVVGLEAPGHVPVPDAVGRVDSQGGAAAVAVAPAGADALAVDLPVDRLDGLALRDGVVAGPAPAVAEPLELHLLDQAFADHDRVGGPVEDVGDPDLWPADGARPAARDPPAVGGVARGPVDRAGGVAGVHRGGEREGDAVGLGAALPVAVELERVGPGAARPVVALRPLRADVAGEGGVGVVEAVAGAAAAASGSTGRCRTGWWR